MIRKLFGRLGAVKDVAVVPGDEKGPPEPRQGGFSLFPNAGLGLAPSAPPTGAPAGTLIQKLAAAGKGQDFKTLRLVKHPTRTSPTTAAFTLGGVDGQRLRAGEQILMELPEEFRARPIYQVILEHRQVQDEKTSELSDDKRKWDDTPGITALHFHSNKKAWTGSWRYWKAPWGSTGAPGGKYAEVRDDWEAESHFDFKKHGTGGVDRNWFTRRDLLTADALRVRGIGVDPTFVREVLVTFAPPAPDHTVEHIFSPGTAIGDLLTAKGQSFGKDFDKGTYPGALELFPGSDGGVGRSDLPEGATYSAGQLQVPLESGRVFSGVEIACGDTKPDGVRRPSGGMGSSGHSKLRIGILRAGHDAPDWFMEGHGVPPQGVLFAGPKSEYRAQAGDKLVFAADVDPTYVMGYRLSYLD